MATYKHLRSSTANKRPTTSIADGQLAINTNTASPGLFFKDSAGTGIVKVGPVHVGTTAPNSTPAGSSGNYLGEQWLDTSVSPAQMKVWNGSAWIGVVADELPVSKLQDGAAGQIVQTDSAGTGVEWSSTANLPLGSAAAPAYRFQGDGDSGVYSPGANQVAISTAGTGRLFVDASGRVGVGVSPVRNFHIHQPLASTDLIFKLSNAFTGSTTSDGFEIQSFVSDGSILFNNRENAPLQFRTNDAERLRITSNGKVGVGTSAPIFTTDILSGTANTGANANNPSQLSVTGPNKSLTAGGATVFINSNSDFAVDTGGSIALSGRNTTSSTNSVVWGVVKGAKENTTSGHTAGYLAFASTNHAAGSLVEAMRIDSSQRVGINTANPAYPLVVSASGASGIELGPAFSGTANLVQHYDRTGGAYVDAVNDAAQHRFNISGTERARIDTSGRLLVGTSSDSGGALLQVNGDRVRIATAKTPASASATGTAGEVCWDTNYIYVCTATNTWKRAALSTW